MEKKNYNQEPQQVISTKNRKLYSFERPNENIDFSVVNSFGEEWKKFHQFSDIEINKLGRDYFDILDETIVNKNTYAIDIGCGTGRFTKYLSDKIGFIEAIDPSEAIFTADKLLEGVENVRLSVASTDNIPFENETFDFGMSIGVLHHIPNTPRALQDCVKKIKIGGHFYVYLYYNLDNKGKLFRCLLGLVTSIRKITSKLPIGLKKLVCDLIAIFIYMPFVLLGRFLRVLKLNRLAKSLPLSVYQDYTFFIIRNDALDRFGTSLEQRFSKNQIEQMMINAGLGNIKISENIPYWHAVGKRLR
ncbi:MAG: class I SAM-dependent methyltransferase [Saprospiraceae bacterium]|nr:class I SAM-dependent methyltransferase [Saprospiraceae bacterium]